MPESSTVLGLGDGRLEGRMGSGLEDEPTPFERLLFGTALYGVRLFGEDMDGIGCWYGL
jgi:hypothetical protein